MTTPDAKLIDHIVREVLSRLDPADDKATKATRPAGDGELVVNSPVVSLSVLDGRLDGVRRLVVPTGAVVTPSAGDELRQRGIAIVKEQRAERSRGVTVNLLLAVHRAGFDSTPLEAALAGEEHVGQVGVEQSDCLIAAVDAAAAFVAQSGNKSRVALLTSPEPAAATCLANRHSGVRAVLGTSVGRLAVDAASVGANVLVLDSRSTSALLLKQLAVDFCRLAPLECPQPLKKRLADSAAESSTIAPGAGPTALASFWTAAKDGSYTSSK